MKQKVITFILSLIIGSGVFSAQAQWRYGFNPGGSFAKATLDNASGYSLKNRSGFRGGLIVEYQSERSGVAFDGSVLYTRYNTMLEDNTLQKMFDFGRNFIEIPLNIKYKFWLPSTNNLVAPMLFAGPSLMFAIDRKEAPLKQKTFQPGVNIGAGIDAANILQISTGYRFCLGNACDVFSGCPDAKLHTNGWFLQAILLFDF